MTTRNLTMLLILAAIAVVTWLAGTRTAVDGPGGVAPPPVSSGYYILEARIFGSDAEGRRMYELNAGQALQGNRGEPIALDRVEILYAGDTGSDWRIRAARASLDETSNLLSLQGNVTATRIGGSDGDVVRLITERLDYDPSTQIVQTDTNVRFELGMGSLDATGMRASLTDSTIELRSNIRGQFVP